MNLLSVKTKLFLSFIFLFMLPIISLGIIGYQLITKMMIDQTITKHQEALNQVVKVIDENFSNIDSYGTRLSQTEWAQQFMFTYPGNELTITDLNNYDHQLKLFNTHNEFVDDISISFKDKDLVLSSSGHSNRQWFFEETFNSNQFNEEILREVEENNKKQLLRASITSYGREKNGYIYIMPLIHSFNKDDTRGVLITFINDITISKLFHAYEEQNIGVKIQNSLIPDGDNKSTAGYSIWTNDNQFDHQIGYVLKKNTDTVPLTITLNIPENFFNKEIKNIQQIFLIGISLLLLFGVFGSFFLTKHNYRPLSKLIDFFNQIGVKEMTHRNEYEWLKNSITSIVNQEQKIKRQLQDQKTELKNVYLKKLILDDQSLDPKILKALDFLDITLPYSYIQCAVLVGEGVDATLVESIISNLTNNQENKVYTFNYNNHWIIILNKNSDSNVSFEEIAEFLIDQHDPITIGVGRVKNGIGNIRESYIEAKTAADYRLIKDDEGLIQYDQIKNNSQFYYYPIDQEYQIINFLNLNEVEKAVDIFKDLLGKNIKQNIAAKALMNFTLDVRFTALKLLKNEDHSYLYDFKKDFKNIDEIILSITKTYQDVAKALERETSNRYKNTLESIINYVDQNIDQYDLSLKEIADQFGYSKSYVSKIFSDQIGCNYLTYLHKKRVNNAKKLLNLNHLDVKMIANKVGFESDATFRRVFKKYTGFSPAQYKKVQDQK